MSENERAQICLTSTKRFEFLKLWILTFEFFTIDAPCKHRPDDQPPNSRISLFSFNFSRIDEAVELMNSFEDRSKFFKALWQSSDSIFSTPVGRFENLG